ncbi:FtsW/RodA/SpoVE family cell cycle protein [Salininema proteolyticum]|uniref:FtsW/RodA/SpoVE family cell cycle protein n=1 Tax=Salininema proteolyticum TaxID=1607685 RepID=A0ABV8TX60_9ACTN
MKSPSFSAVATATEPSEPTPVPESGMRRDDAASLGMLLVAGLALVGLQAVIDQNLGGSVTLNAVTIPAMTILAGLIAWTAARKWAPYADPVFIPVATFFSGIGIVFIRRLQVTMDPQYAIDFDAGMFAGTGGRQLMYTFVGVIAFAVIMAFLKDHRDLKKFSYLIAAVSLVGIILPALLPASISYAGGAKLWIRIGPISIQPSEFGNIGLIIFFSHYLVAKRDVLTLAGRRFLGLQFPRVQDLVPIMAVLATSVFVMVFEAALGQSLMIFAAFLAMLYMATRRFSWLAIGLLSFAGACVAIYPFFAHLQQRVKVFLDPYNPEWRDSIGFQLVKALDSMVDGGLLGTGPGAGKPNAIPLAESDFIFPALSHELGLMAVTALLLMYFLLISRGFKASVLVRDNFGKLLASGLSFLIAFQVFVVVGGATALIPMTGAAMPFLAAGGSSILATWILVGLLVKISHEGRKPHHGNQGLQKVAAPKEFLEQQAAEKRAREAAEAAAAERQATEMVDLSTLRGQTGQPSVQSPPTRNAPGAPPVQSPSQQHPTQPGSGQYGQVAGRPGSVRHGQPPSSQGPGPDHTHPPRQQPPPAQGRRPQDSDRRDLP